MPSPSKRTPLIMALADTATLSMLYSARKGKTAAQAPKAKR
jgi:hypothetical protein